MWKRACIVVIVLVFLTASATSAAIADIGGADAELVPSMMLQASEVLSSPAEHFVYTIGDGKITITDYTGPGGDVVIPSTIESMPVTSIGSTAFSFSWGMRSVSIGSSITSIGLLAFRGCYDLKNIEVDEANSNYASLDGVLYSKDMATLIACPAGRAGTFTIPDGVRVLELEAFSRCESLTGITIPDSVTSIGNQAFEFCDALMEINIPDSVTSIGGNAFYFCSKLTGITIPDSVTSMGSGVFSRCTSLITVQFLGNAPSRSGIWYNINPDLKVYHIDGAEGFDPSLWSEAEVIAVTAPGSPTGLEATVGVGEVSLTWASPSNLGEQLTYEVWHGTSEDCDAWTLFTTFNALTATVTGLEHDTEYHFGVKAVNIAGASGFMSTSITTPTSPDAPDVVAAVGDGQVELIWDAPYDGGAAIVEYIIYHDGKEIARITDVSKISFVVNGLDNGVEYAFQVAAKNAVGIGGTSEAVSATPRTVPDAPTEVEATLSDDHSSATLVWKAPDFNGGSEIVGYEVWFRKGGGHWTVLTDVNALTVTIDGLEHSTTYLFSVKAVNIAGASGTSSISVTTLAPPDAPEVSVVVGDGQANLTWNIPNDGGSAIVEYVVYRDGEEIVRTTEAAYSVIGLTNGVEYRFQVAARNAIGIGPNATEISAMPLPDEVPLYGKVVDANENGLAGVKVSLENGSSVTTGDDGRFSFMASRGAHVLTFSAGHIVTTTKNINVNGMELDTGAAVVDYASSGVFGGFEYATNGGEITIKRYVGPGGDVTIPSTINAMPVTIIGSWAFKQCYSLTSVTLSDGVTSIGDYAFHQCSSLTRAVIPDSVINIGGGAFYGCTSLTGVIIPGSVTYIGDYAFSLCSSLTTVTIPDRVMYIGYCAFQQCASLINIEVAVDNADYASLDGALYNNDKTTLIVCPAGMTGAFVVPDGVTRIEDNAFRDCSKLTSVVMHDGVTSIGWSAFFACSSLTNMIIPDSVESIDNYAFSHCSSMISIAIGNGVITIGDEAFSGCRSLTSVVIPDSVTTIGRSAFGGCYTLTSVLLGSGVTMIDETAFSGCSSVVSIIIPSSVTSIGGYAFNACNNLTSMYFEGDAPEYPYSWRVIKPGLKVYYIDGAGGFDRSRWGVAELIALTAPGAPVDLGSAAGKGDVTLEWAAPSDDGGSEVTGYEVWYGTSADSSAWVLFSTVDALSATVTGLDSGTIYYFGIKAVNFAGASEFSTTFITTPNTITFDANGGAGAVPEAITADHDSSVDLPQHGVLVKNGHTFGGWSLTPGGSAVDDPFTLTYDVTLYAVWKIDTIIPSAESGLVFTGDEQIGVIEGTGYTLTGNGATDAGEYTATATLVNGYIWSDGTSDAKQITWTIVPKEVVVTPNGKTKIYGEDNPTLTYELSETVDIEGALSRAAGEEVGTYVITIGTLSAKNSNYILKMVGMVQFEIKAAYPSAPNITNVEPGNGQVLLSWNVPYDGGADIDIYVIYQDGTEIVRTTGTTYVVTGLTSGQAYTFQVVAKNAAGTGSKSESVSATPLPAMAPISGKVVDADGNGLAGVKVTLDNRTSVMTGDDGSFSIMASQGVHVLTFSGDNIEGTTKNVTVYGMDFDLKFITVTLREDGGDNTTLLVAIIGAIAAVIVAAFVFVRMKK